MEYGNSGAPDHTMRNVMIGFAVVLVLAAIGVGVYFLFFRKKNEDTQAPANDNSGGGSGSDQSGGGSGSDQSGGGSGSTDQSGGGSSTDQSGGGGQQEFSDTFGGATLSASDWDVQVAETGSGGAPRYLTSTAQAVQVSNGLLLSATKQGNKWQSARVTCNHGLKTGTVDVTVAAPKQGMGWVYLVTPNALEANSGCSSATPCAGIVAALSSDSAFVIMANDSLTNVSLSAGQNPTKLADPRNVHIKFELTGDQVNVSLDGQTIFTQNIAALNGSTLVPGFAMMMQSTSAAPIKTTFTVKSITIHTDTLQSRSGARRVRRVVRGRRSGASGARKVAKRAAPRRARARRSGARKVSVRRRTTARHSRAKRASPR